MRGLARSIGLVTAGLLGVGSAVAIGADSDPDVPFGSAATHPKRNTLTINGVPFKRGSGNTLTINGVPFKRGSGNTLTINGVSFHRGRGNTLTINGTSFKSSGGTLTINGVIFRPGTGPTVPPEIAAQLRGPAGPTGPAGPAGPAGAAGPSGPAGVPSGPAATEEPGPITVATGAGSVQLAQASFTGTGPRRLLVTGGFNTACDPCGAAPLFPAVSVAIGAAEPLVRRNHPPMTIDLSRNGVSLSEVIQTPDLCGPCTFTLSLSVPSPSSGGGPASAVAASEIRLGLVDLGPAEG